ncbi:hypothetical protein [Bordetella genomosp. 12]|uniref:Uncharacterized protein n=1 Tax=Bordetella genomosp. 12 TaxID=463035 RepID=A0A261VN95_9BORD|nr:hypothetical protein [Bordetella genomosp. 12]OZI74952.1 hypothetical protein CAL22_11045 [Bordetella genomosp. 12]
MNNVFRRVVIASLMAVAGGAAQANEVTFELDLAQGCHLVRGQGDEPFKVVCAASNPGTVELRPAARAPARLATIRKASGSQTRLRAATPTMPAPLTIAIGY